VLTDVYQGVTGRWCRTGQGSRHSEDKIVREIKRILTRRCYLIEMPGGAQ